MISGMGMESLQSPALLLYGRRSPFVVTGRMLEGRIPRAKLIVTRADHNLPVQRDAWVARRLNAFFA